MLNKHQSMAGTGFVWGHRDVGVRVGGKRGGCTPGHGRSHVRMRKNHAGDDWEDGGSSRLSLINTPPNRLYFDMARK